MGSMKVDGSVQRGGAALRASLIVILGTQGFAGCATPSSTDEPAREIAEEKRKGAEAAALHFGAPTSPRASFAVMTVPDQPSPLEMRGLRVEVEVDGRMARTEVTQVFYNHTDREQEGTYTFTLPRGAAIARLSMDVKGKMVEGELVEREQARSIYEGIVHKKKDPALMEWQGGERFETSVFPIEPTSTKTVLLAYEQLLPEQDGEAIYRYELPSFEGEPEGSHISAFFFHMRARGAGAVTFSGFPAEVVASEEGAQVVVELDRFRPSGPFEVRLDRGDRAEVAMSVSRRGAERFFLADVAPSLPERPAGEVRDLVLAVDTSAGIGRVELERVKATAAGMIAALPEGARVEVVSGDHRVKACGAPAGARNRPAAAACVGELTSGGGTDLEGLLAAAASAGQAMGRPASIVIFSDGVASLGELDGDLMLAGARRRASAAMSLHAVAVGHVPDLGWLGALAGAGRGHLMQLTPGDDPAQAAKDIAQKAREPLLTDLSASVIEGEVEGLSPGGRVNLSRGQSLAILGRVIGDGRARIALRGLYDGAAYERILTVDAAQAPEGGALPRFWARAWISGMEQGDVDRPRVVAASLKYGVMSRYTSFLVLESEEAYERFKIARRKEQERVEAQANLTKGVGDLKAVMEGVKSPDPESKPDGEIVGELQEKLVKVEESDQLLEVDKPKPVEEMNKRLERLDPEKVEAPARLEPLQRLEERLDWDGDLAKDMEPSTGAEKKKSKQGGKRREITEEDILEMWSVRGSADAALRSRLMAMMIRIGREGEASAFLAESVEAFKADEVGLQGLFGEAAVRRQFSNEYKRLLTSMVADGRGGSEVALALWSHLVEMGQLKELRAIFEARGLPVGVMGEGLRSLAEADEGEAVAMIEAWRASGRVVEAAIFGALDEAAVRVQRLRLARLESAGRLVVEGDLRVEVVGAYVEVGVEVGRSAEALALVERVCRPEVMLGGADAAACLGWLSRFGVEGEGLRAVVVARRLVEIRSLRDRDVGERSLILEAARLLESQGRGEEAARCLSELVEFAPHDFESRSVYAEALSEREELVGACEQYGTAAQLNPSRREVFRAMVGLRRREGAEAGSLRECLVRGVSKLPVVRDLSMVMTWEDPSADVDLHVFEPGGAEVSYQALESEAGGLLYYDVTDGFGPEIYVMGSAPKGVYRLKVVYYRGEQRSLRGVLTVLRRAGSPEETRQDIPFVLPKADSGVQIPVGSLRL